MKSQGLRKTFVTALADDSFAPGVINLHRSLQHHRHTSKLLVLVNSDLVSPSYVALLMNEGIDVKLVANIENPNYVRPGFERYAHTYFKLRIFELFEYEKIIYLDADMLVLENIDHLFDEQHLSSVVSGGLCHESWKHFNTGLLVIVPDRWLFEEITERIQTITSPDGSDQGFLQSFFPEWPDETRLHLDHRYNVPVGYLNTYCEHFNFYFNYTGNEVHTNVSVLHYWGVDKPWTISKDRLTSTADPKGQSMVLWHDLYAGKETRFKPMTQV